MIRRWPGRAAALLAGGSLWLLFPEPVQALRLKKIVHVVTAPVRAAATVVQATAKAVVKVVAPLPDVAKKVVVAESPVEVFVYRVAADHEKAGEALKDTAKAPGVAVVATSQEIDTTLTQQNNLAVTVAGTIAGDPGKTVMTLGTGPERLSQEFATTLAIQGGEVLQGQNPAIFAASPLAAALRSAQQEFAASAKPIPDDVKAHLTGVFTPDQLANVRYRVAAISISIPDMVTHARKAFGDDFGVTAGNVITFSIDPGGNYHWWAHEIRHTVQYSQWGIDLFALKYVTNCHGVESDAENTAQAAFPYAQPVSLGC